MSPQPTILYVEDEILIRFVTAEGLRDEGFEVIEASEADEALVVLQSDARIDLVITDIRMPGSMDGLGLTSFIKANQSNLPVMVVSSHLPSEPDCRPDRFLAKPVLFPALVDAINDLIGPRWKSERHSGSIS